MHRIQLPLLATLPILLGSIPASAGLVYKDPGFSNSVLLSEFRTEPGATFANGQIQGGSPDAGGTVIYESNGTPNDPKIIFNTGFLGAGGGNLDLNLFPNLRSRHTVLNGDANVTAWRLTPLTGQGVNLASNGAGLAESQGTIPNPNTTGGYRFDPEFSGTDWTMEFDYVYADRGATVGFEFGHDGDNAGIAVHPHITGGAVAGGVFAGTINGDDPNINGAVSLNPNIYRYAEIRLRVPVGSNRIDLFWANNNGGFHPDRRVTLDSAGGLDGNWHTYVIDFNSNAQWTGGGTVTNFRLDPTAGTAVIGQDIAIDYIRFQEMNIVPEPATVGLFLAGASLAFFFVFDPNNF